MNYPIPENPQGIFEMRQQPVDEELVAAAIAGVIKIVRSQGQSLEQLTAEVLADDTLLDKQQRRWLSQVVSQAWDTIS
ncbi:hypothetical protein [Brunnivagina elsteri]|uniref:Uncharacterized protein n=1 Tax=Brunnivagina elsteri CCALA 953 TaxID=987040 RepID=A0A2A2TMP1_9CYAN|nr:hypothetical protein [Calothrix elsteri]PAX59759.1 hypothetical protein CK510_05405 [Calothrix elsteri CCALA 953]